MTSDSNQKPEVLVAYVASPHAGYLNLFRAYAGGKLYILGKEFIEEHVAFRRHLPGNDPQDARTMVHALGIFASVEVLERTMVEKIPPGIIAMPDEDTSRKIAEVHLKDRKVFFDDRWKLRWDWGSSQKNERPEDETVTSFAELDQALMGLAQVEAQKSSDWWRQVGALLAQDGRPLLTSFNRHMPSEHSAYVLGDPRSNFEQGVGIEVSIASHAERRILAIAAREGIRTLGCDLYVTTFPCPPCAYSLAESGIRRLFYRDGYSSLEGAHALSAAGIQLIRVAN